MSTLSLAIHSHCRFAFKFELQNSNTHNNNNKQQTTNNQSSPSEFQSVHGRHQTCWDGGEFFHRKSWSNQTDEARTLDSSIKGILVDFPLPLALLSIHPLTLWTLTNPSIPPLLCIAISWASTRIFSSEQMRRDSKLDSQHKFKFYMYTTV